MLLILPLLAISPSLVSAFSNSVPLLAWSSSGIGALSSLSTGGTQLHADSLIQSLVEHNRICDYDAVVFVDQPGLRAEDLRSLPYSTRLAKYVTSSASRQLPYIRQDGLLDLSSFANVVSVRCESKLVSSSVGQGVPMASPGSRHVFLLDSPSLQGVELNRKDVFADAESNISNDYAVIAAAFPNHIAILTSSFAPSLRTRAPLGQTPAYLNAPAGNGTVANLGILKRYQLMTPGLIITLLVAFFVIVPIILIGLNAIGSIQSPVRSEGPKYNAQEKKNQ